MTLCFILSDLWGFGPDNPPGEDNDWTAWDEFVTNNVQDLLNLENADPNKIYISPWNEANSGLPKYPNHVFWKFTGQYSFENHFMDTWKHAYDAIKAVDSDLKVMGPEFAANFNYDLEHHFLIQARDLDVVPDILNWHYPSSGLVEQANGLNEFMNAHNISVEGIAIGEYSGPTYRYYGNFGFYIAEMERASIIEGNKAPFKNAYFNPSGYGLIGSTISFGTDHEGGHKRGGWWVLKKYADMAGNYALETTNLETTEGNKVEVYATYKDNTLKIFLGTFTVINTETDPPEPKNPYLGNTLINLIGFDAANSQISYKVYQLTLNKVLNNPNTSGEQGPPEIVDSGTLQQNADGTIPLTIQWENYYDCYYVEVYIGPPLLAVYISGPYEISSGDYHAWEANPSGGEPFYEYNWQSRLYNEHIGWTNWQDRGLGKYMLSRYTDHNYNQLEWKVTITDADNNTAEGFFTVTIV